MNRRFHLSVAVVCASGLLSTGASAQDDSGEEQTAQNPIVEREDCFTLSSIRNFDGLSDRHVYLENGNEHFLLTMDRQCLGLSNAENIALANPSNRVCSNSLAELTYRGIGRRLETCWIERVESVEDEATARDMAARRTAIDDSF